MTTTRMTDEERTDARTAAMLRRDEKAYARIEQREAAAAQMIGELSSGKCYVYPVGGKYREGTRADLVAFLVRNNYA